MIYGFCEGCRQKKFFLKHRVYKLQAPKLPIKSNNPLCRSCFKNINKMLQ